MVPTSTESAVTESLSRWLKNGRPNIDGIGSTKDVGLSCPAASEDHGDAVFAMFDEESKVLTFLSELIEIPEIVKENLDLHRFSKENRLVGKCYTTGCHHWQGACRLGYFVSSVTVRSRPNQCAITDSCRWLRENGPAVCGPCAQVRNVIVAPIGCEISDTL